MTPERMADVVMGWVRLYTRDLPGPIAQRRADELAADLHDHIALDRANGVDEWRIARDIASRMVRGVAADVMWRGRQLSTLEETMKTSKPLYRSAVRIAVGVALTLSLPLVAMQFSDAVVWSLADFVLAGLLIAVVGVAPELAMRKAGNLPTAIGIGALGVAAGVLGEADDAPGLVLVGILLVAGACAIGARKAQHSR